MNIFFFSRRGKGNRANGGVSEKTTNERRKRNERKKRGGVNTDRKKAGHQSRLTEKILQEASREKGWGEQTMKTGLR